MQTQVADYYLLTFRLKIYEAVTHLRTPETWPTGEAHSSVVSTTPISGSTRVNFFTSFGNISFSDTPTMVGTSTTWNVDSASPCDGQVHNSQRCNDMVAELAAACRWCAFEHALGMSCKITSST